MKKKKKDVWITPIQFTLAVKITTFTINIRDSQAFTCADPEGTGGPDPIPLKNYKNIGFLSNIRPDH